MAAFWFILLLLMTGGFVFITYFFRPDTDEFTSAQRKLLSALRFSSMLGAAILLLSLIVENRIAYTEKPILVVAVDNSNSMSTTEVSKEDLNAYVRELSEKAKSVFDVQMVGFGENIEKVSTLNFDDRTSDYSAMISYVGERFYNLNLGSVVVIGDGIYNVGRNPGQFTNNIPAPIYSIGIGDTSIVSDQSIIEVHHNRSVFLGNKFQIDVELNFTDVVQKSTTLEIMNGNEVLAKKTIPIPQATYYTSTTFSVEAKKPGIQSYTVRLNKFSNEENVDNNVQQFNLRVHEQKYEVLILSSAPHPDLGAQLNFLQEEANFQVTLANINEYEGKIDPYNAIILYQLPANDRPAQKLIREIIEKKKSVFIVVGPNTSLSELSNLQVGINIKPTTIFEEVTPNFSTNFSLFGIPQELFSNRKIYPPVLTPFTGYQLNEDYSILAKQTINGIDLDLPLLAVGNINKHKIGVLMGEGIWRWGLQEYLNFGTNEHVSELFVNLMTYLCIDSKSDRFNIQYQQVIPENSQVRFRASLLNTIYEPVTESLVGLVLTDSAGIEYNYVFDANELGYTLNVGYLNAGKYSIKAKAAIGEDTLTAKGAFVVQKINFEQQNTTADFNVLRSLSVATGGTFLNYRDRDQLFDRMKEHKNIQPKTYYIKAISDFIDLKWLFVGIVLLVALEWFLRKFWGSY